MVKVLNRCREVIQLPDFNAQYEAPEQLDKMFEKPDSPVSVPKETTPPPHYTTLLPDISAYDDKPEDARRNMDTDAFKTHGKVIILMGNTNTESVLRKSFWDTDESLHQVSKLLDM